MSDVGRVLDCSTKVNDTEDEYIAGKIFVFNNTGDALSVSTSKPVKHGLLIEMHALPVTSASNKSTITTYLSKVVTGKENFVGVIDT